MLVLLCLWIWATPALAGAAAAPAPAPAPTTAPAARAEPPVPAAPAADAEPAPPPGRAAAPETTPEPSTAGDAPLEPAPSTPAESAPGADAATSIAPEPIALSEPAVPAATLTTPTLDARTRRGVPPFWIDIDTPTHRSRAVALPPLFFHRTPKEGHPEQLRHADLSLTFGWYSSARQRRNYISPLALYYGYFSERKTVWGAVPLLMGYKRVGEQFNFGQFPLVWWWGTKYVRNVLVIPFHYQQKAPEGFRGVSGLLVWYGRKDLEDADALNDRRWAVAAPVFWRFQRGQQLLDVSPLYIGGWNKLKGVDHRTVLPFAHWSSHEFGNRRELWTLAWVRRTDRARQRTGWAVPLALTGQRKTADGSLFTATPLVWRSRDELRDRTRTVVGPVAWGRDPRQRWHVVAPLWVQTRDLRDDITTSVLLPLAYARRTPERTAVWTVLGGGARGPAGTAWGVPALTLVSDRRADGRTTEVFTPLLWHVARPAGPQARGGRARAKATDVWVSPLAYGGKVGEGRGFGVPLLGLAHGRDPRRSYTVATPALWVVRGRDPARPRTTVVFGPVYGQRNRLGGVSGGHGGVAPLVFAGSDAHRRYAVAPLLLFSHHRDLRTQRALTLSPFVVHARSPDHTTWGVLGLAWDVQRRGAGGPSRDTVVAPLFVRRERGQGADRRVATISLLGGAATRGSGADMRRTWFAGPVYGSRGPGQRGGGFVPLVFHRERTTPQGRSVHTAVVPLVLRRRTPGDDLDVWTPLVWRSEHRGPRARKGLAIVPLYFRQRQPGGVDVDAGLPWFWARNTTRRTHTLIAGPFVHRLSRTQLNTATVPLYWWQDSLEKRRLIALPVIVHLENKQRREHTTVALPLWVDRQQANGSRFWTAFPVVWSRKRLWNYTRVSTVPIYIDTFNLQKNQRFVGAVPFAWRYQKRGFKAGDDPTNQYTLWGGPGVIVGKDGRGRRTHGAFLYYYDDDPDPPRPFRDGVELPPGAQPERSRRLYTPLAGVNSRPGHTLGWYVGPVAVRTTRTQRRVAVLPLVWHQAHRVENRRLTWVLPPVFIAKRDEDRRWFQSMLVVWHARRPDRVTTAILPPLFVVRDAYAQRRTAWLAPLYVRDNHFAKDTVWTSLPPLLYVQRRKGEDLTAVQFPLVWHFERGPKRVTVGALAWFDFRKPERTLQLVPAVYTRVARPERDTHVIGPGLAWWRRGKGPNEGDLDWRALLGLFGGGVRDGKRYTAIFGLQFGPGARKRTR